MNDLFGEPIRDEPQKKYEPKGYAGRPGGGPDGETCKTCEHSTKVQGGSKAYWKCRVIKHRWTGGPGTDIKISSPACFYWKKHETPT